MKRHEILAQAVPPVEERIRLIESEPLLPNIHAVLDSAAEAAPDTIAVDFFEEGVALTYAQLRDRVEALARGFAGLGMVAGDRVGVMLPNIAAFPVTWLALARLGAVMVPLNIAYTSREVGYVLGDAEAQWLCVHDSLLGTVVELDPGKGRPPESRTIVVGEAREGCHRWSDVLAAGVRGEGVLPPADAVGLDHLINIQYTSGTTGMPKGCMLTQRYWVICGKVNAFRDGRRYERFLASVPFYYMDPQWLLMMSFYQRGTLFVALRQSSSRFMRWVREHRINFTLFPEIVFKLPPEPEDAQNEIVRVNVYGLSPAVHEELEERYDMFAREAFGMTEIGSGMFMPIEATHMVGSGSCGRPSPFRQARIVSPQGKVLGDDEPGELQIRGPGIMEGYYNNPRAVAAAFDDGWFRTGDLARRDAGGYYYIIGRLKDMIRRSGENISASEVEAVLRSVPEVVEAAALPVRDELRGEEVKAFVVLHDGLTPVEVPPHKIFDACSRQLARFKVPRYLAYRGQAIPKTPSEKIAKHKLLSEEESCPSPVFDFVENRWIAQERPPE